MDMAMRFALLAGAVTALAGCQPHSPIRAASVDQDLLAKVHDPAMQCAPTVTASLSEAGLTAAAIERVVVEKNLARLGNGDEMVTGYRAWANLNDCKGYVVVDMDSICRVVQVYSRGDCKVPGMAHY